MDFTLTSSELGRLAITEDALAQIVRLTAVECYGVVGLSSSRLKRLLGRSGIQLSGTDGSVSIAVHVVVAHGLNLAEVASTVRISRPSAGSPGRPPRRSRPAGSGSTT